MIAKDDSRPTTRFEPLLQAARLFKQGTELVALQRDNLEIGNIAPQDISKQMAAWSVLTSAYRSATPTTCSRSSRATSARR